MTNAEIIATAKLANNITEEAHTFAHWKKLGYFVKRGEKAAFSARIWKYAGKKIEKDGEMDEQDMKMFMKKAHFFTRSQVEKAL